MGRLSDIVLRGMQFEMQQEAQSLENDARRLQMEGIIQEKIAVGQRVKPGYAEAWDKITDPNTPTSEIGALMTKHIPATDIQDLLKARYNMQGVHLKSEMTMARTIEEWKQRFLLQEQTINAQNQRSQDRIDSQEKRHGESLALHGKVADARLEHAGRVADARVEQATEKGRKLYSPDDARDVVAMRLYGTSMANLASDKDYSDETGGLDQQRAAQLAQEAADDLIRYQNRGYTSDEALRLALSGVKELTPKQKVRGPGKDVPASREYKSAVSDEEIEAARMEEEQLNDMIEASIASQGEEIDENRIVQDLQGHGIKIDKRVAAKIRKMLPKE